MRERERKTKYRGRKSRGQTVCDIAIDGVKGERE